MKLQKRDKEALKWLPKYLRLVDYLSVAQLYLQDNCLIKDELKLEHFKKRILGHFGTVPGLNFIYAHLNYLICKHKAEVLFVTGPGHGAPAILANLFVEKTLNDFYPNRFPLDGKGASNIIHDFSWPHSGFPSHVTPGVPGSILEGGELGYSVSTAYGAAMDNPDLIVCAVIGDGEAESGPLAASFHSNKFLNPKESGAVLPILHVNGYKISNPTIYGTMDNKELKNLFTGFGYNVKIVEEPNIDQKMLIALEESYQEIRAIQKKARGFFAKAVLKPKFPMIVLKTVKGWKGIHSFAGKLIEGSFRSHGIPVENLHGDEKAFMAVKKWLESYGIKELIDAKGSPKKELLKFVPQGKFRMGACKYALGGMMRKNLIFPPLKKYEIKIPQKGNLSASSMDNLGGYLRDIIKANKKNFRIFCPDEIESNKLQKIFEATKRQYLWPVEKDNTEIAPLGRAQEMLSEHTLNGWMEGYLLTGRHGIFVSYEAFTMIISSMVDQFAKFIKQSQHVSWRKPIPSAIYLLSSVGWRQDHNGYSHQNPSFVSNVLLKHGRFCQIYYPADSNSLIVAMEESLNKTDGISVIVAGKRPIIQWLSLNEAKEQAKNGIGIWEFIGGKEGTENPDVVVASAGDYITQETILGIKMALSLYPKLKIRYVNISELNGLSLGDYGSKEYKYSMTEKKFAKYFTEDKPIILNYHGYKNDIEQILWEYTDPKRFSMHGYEEEGSTTTPFDMAACNKVSRYHIAIDILEQAQKNDWHLAQVAKRLIGKISEKLSLHKQYIEKYGDDPEEIKKENWLN